MSVALISPTGGHRKHPRDAQDGSSRRDIRRNEMDQAGQRRQARAEGRYREVYR